MKPIAMLPLVLLAGCGNNTSGPQEQGSPLDVLTGLENAYCSRDAGAFEDILQKGYFHTIPESEWDDFDGDGIIDTGWDAELQMTWIDDFFSACQEITLSIDTGGAVIDYVTPEMAVVSFDFQMQYTGTAPDYLNREGSWYLTVSAGDDDVWKLLEVSDMYGWVGFIP